jgi:transposase
MMGWTAPVRHRCARLSYRDINQREPSVDQITRIFIDTSKTVFQLHGVDAAERVVLRRRLRRSQVLAFFAKLDPVLIGLEACAGSHHWARALRALGHEVKLAPAQYVTPYVMRGKNDAIDAEAGCEAMNRPKVQARFVAVKSEEQQAALMLASVRDRMIQERTRLSNAIRGHAAEFGVVAPRGLRQIEDLLGRIAADDAMPELAREMFEALRQAWRHLGAQIRDLDRRFMAWRRRDATSRRLAQIPSVGPIGAALLVLKAPDPAAFKSARHFAAWMGLTPKDHSTAGKHKLGAITKAGDEALRSTLVVGATALLQQVRKGRGPRSPWLLALLARKEPKEAAVALANKVARIAWRMMISGHDYDPERLLRQPPAAAA